MDAHTTRQSLLLLAKAVNDLRMGVKTMTSAQQSALTEQERETIDQRIEGTAESISAVLDLLEKEDS